ncbi:uncharacterized protein LOC115729100 [Rhodamnia argentea]|uniref:Uncharacterized protein LOC115729100 n=1 Tax=Rhodamnia argentea TaxID=178133 RepID=A0ABM3H1X0_9MYRT|nr:uncharacterized protein LOC115729100 [Rhodamnia argentea]
MRKLAHKQICALLPVKTPKFSIRVIVATLVFAGFTGSGFLPLPAKIPLLALSAVFFVASFLKKKAVDENGVRHKNPALHHIGVVDKHFRGKTQQVLESDGERIAAQTVRFRKGSLDFPAGGESSDESIESETFELNFISSDNGSCSPLVRSSEDNDDDDDDSSLIEISLPSNVCLGDFPPKSIVGKQEAKEILTDDEINEEDKLIELDISIGSIRCSKFEI